MARTIFFTWRVVVIDLVISLPKTTEGKPKPTPAKKAAISLDTKFAIGDEVPIFLLYRKRTDFKIGSFLGHTYI